MNRLFLFFFFQGADIKEMQSNTFAQTIKENFLQSWNQMGQAKKPIIAAVNGYAVSRYFINLLKGRKKTSPSWTIK